MKTMPAIFVCVFFVLFLQSRLMWTRRQNIVYCVMEWCKNWDLMTESFEPRLNAKVIAIAEWFELELSQCVYKKRETAWKCEREWQWTRARAKCHRIKKHYIAVWHAFACAQLPFSFVFVVVLEVCVCVWCFGFRTFSFRKYFNFSLTSCLVKTWIHIFIYSLWCWYENKNENAYTNTTATVTMCFFSRPIALINCWMEFRNVMKSTLTCN